jgi:integrase/recombinase XerD
MRPMKRKARQYLAFPEWPPADRNLWEATFAPRRDPFDAVGTDASDRTIQQLRYTYGKFLFFLAAEHPDLLDRPPADRVSAGTVAGFVKWQPASCGSITMGIYVYHLWIALKNLCAGEDWSWLLGVSNRIKSRGRARPERHHLVTSETLYSLGMELMDAAFPNGKPPTSWRVQSAFRDGLIIALLASIPLRRRTLASLRIGKQLVRSGEGWALDIPAKDVKTRRPLDYPLSPELSRRIDIYVNEIRSRTAGAGNHDYLWASCRGRPLGGHSIYSAVRRRTRQALGFPINLHRFRRAAGTLWSVQDPQNVRGVKDLLGHADFATTERYYIMTQSRVAGRVLAGIIDTLRNGRIGRKTPAIARTGSGF